MLFLLLAFELFVLAHKQVDEQIVDHRDQDAKQLADKDALPVVFLASVPL